MTKLPLSAAPYRTQVLMKLIGLGLGDGLSRPEEHLIEVGESFGSDPSYIAKDICRSRGWDA